MLPHLVSFYKETKIKTVWFWHRIKKIDQRNQKETRDKLTIYKFM